ncbi:MAG: hypothetical protein AB1432_01550 [Bacteroidota bacterium]
MSWDAPIGYSTHFKFPKYALGANPGADALNEDLIEAIDSKIYEANQRSMGEQVAKFGIGGVPDSVFKLKVYGDSWITGNEKIDGYSAIGGEVDTNFKQKIHGNAKITGNLTLDGDFYVGGSINQVNVEELNVTDKTIRLNKGGDNNTALNGGITMLGTSESVLATIKYTSSVWESSLDFNLASGKVFKINNVEVLSATTLGTAVVNSSLTKVGTLTQGIWNATAINGQYLNYNTTNLKVTSNQINTIQDIATTSSPTFTNITLSGKIDQQGTNNSEFGSQALLPKQTYYGNLGSLNKKWLTLHASELWVETLVAQNTIATIGGRILVGPTTSLVSDLSSGSTSINVKHNQMSNGDVVYLEADGKIEFIRINSSASGSPGNYYYSIIRDLDGSGANDWYAGDALFNTGQSGNGFIDLYSFRGVKSSQQVGPAIVGNVRNSSTYNDWSEHWAVGNLNGVYGYGSTTYGAAFGKYANGVPNITIDSVNGIRIRNYTTQLAQWDMSGNILIGEVGSGKSNILITSGAVKLRNNTTDLIRLNTDGTATFEGNITSNATITGGIVRTGASGQRVILDGVNGDLRFYSTGEHLTRLVGYHDGVQSYLYTPNYLFAASGLKTNDNIWAYGSLTVANGKYIIDNNGGITKVNNQNPSAGLFLRGDGSSFTPTYLSSSDVTTALGYTPVTNARTINGYALTSNITLTKSDIGLGNVENTALSTWAGSSNLVTVGKIADVLKLGKGLQYDNEQYITVTPTDNSNGYITMTGGKNLLRLYPAGSGYNIGIYGMTDKAIIMVVNVHTSISITVEGKLLAPKQSVLMMYDADYTTVRIVG